MGQDFLLEQVASFQDRFLSTKIYVIGCDVAKCLMVTPRVVVTDESVDFLLQLFRRLPNPQVYRPRSVSVRLPDELNPAIKAVFFSIASPFRMYFLGTFCGQNVFVHHFSAVGTVPDRRVWAPVVEILAWVPLHFGFFSLSSLKAMNSDPPGVALVRRTVTH